MSRSGMVMLSIAATFLTVGILLLVFRSPVVMEETVHAPGMDVRPIKRPEALRELADFTMTRQQPLFSASRQAGSVKEVKQFEGAILERYRLSGTLLSGQKKLVLLQSLDNGQMLRVTEGDTVDQWRLVRIGEDRLVFTRDGENRVYETGDNR